MARCVGTETFHGSSSGHDSNKAESQAAVNASFFAHRVCPEFLPRITYTEKLQSQFEEASQYASWARCFLLGPAGSGKRQLATHFAAEYGRTSGRKVLWIDYEENETFVRDYRQAYFALTGTRVPASSPYGLSLHHLLCTIRRTLERRHEEWILVLLDVDITFENSGLADYLPKNRGQILITTSSAPKDIVQDGVNEETTWMGAKLASCLILRVGNLERQEVHQYYEKAFGRSKEDLEETDCAMFGLGFPRLALSFAHMRWLGTGPRTYVSYFGPQLRTIRDKDRSTAVPEDTSLRFPETMQFIWQTLTNTDGIAIRMTVYISFFSRRHIPWHLLQWVRELQQLDANDLYESRRLLAALGLITVNTTQDDQEEINVHRIVHQWLRNKTRQIQDSDDEYRMGMHQVVVAMTSYFDMEDVNNNGEKMWKIVGHMLRLVRICTKYRLETFSFATFLSRIASFLLNEGAFVDRAERLINQAIRIRAFVRRVGVEVERASDCLAFMRETRVRILLYLSRPKEAKTELKRAFAQMTVSSIGENEKLLLRQRLRALEVEACFLDCDDGTAIGILKEDLKLSTLTEFEKAKQHHWMAKLMICSDLLFPALQHSHMALSHWDHSLDKWKQNEMLRWVDWHATILNRAGKFKAASKILPQLLDQYLSTFGPAAEEAWRVANGLGKTDLSMKKHEELVVRMLTSVFAEDQDLCDNSVTYCLMMLHEFGCRLFSRGRLVEAEGVFRHNINTASARQPPDLGSGGVYDYSKDRLMLVDCLYEQGKRTEARNMRRIFKMEQGFDDNMGEFLRTRWHEHRAARRAYYEALRVTRTKRAEEVLTCSVVSLQNALRRYGCLEDRTHPFSGPKLDIDGTGVGMARKSQVLHLLDYDFVYLTFSNRLGTREILWVPEGQTVIGQYFKFCECRRYRKRSSSLNPVDLAEGNLLRQTAGLDLKPGLHKIQSSITKWLRHGRYDDPHQYMGERLSQGEVEALAEKATGSPQSHSSCADSDHCLSKFTWPKKTYKPPESWTGPDVVCFSETGELTWEPFFLQQGNHEYDTNQFAVPDAVHIPAIRITGADGAPAGVEIHNRREKWQMKITSYFSKLTEKFWDHPIDPKLKKITEEEE